MPPLRCCWSFAALAALLGLGRAGPAAPRPGVLTFELRGTPDPGARDGEVKVLEKPGIYCWWAGPSLRPGTFEVWARARTPGPRGVLHFVLTDTADESHVAHAISRTQRGWVSSPQYSDVYCGTFYWDGSFSPRVSDWSSPGLLVDWVSLVPVAASEVRDPLPGALSQYEAPRFAREPMIDGDLGEWRSVPRLVLGEDSARSSDYGGTADLSAVCQLAWDATYLYVACEVVDNRADFLPDARRLASLWKFDSIQIAFDADGNARSPGYAPDDYEYGVGMTAAGPRAYRWVAGNNLPIGDVPTIEAAVVRHGQAGTTVYEMAIPFKDLLPFRPDRRECGMTVVVNDRDGGAAQRAWLQWTPGIAGSKDPSAFGRLRLVDAAPAMSGVTAALLTARDLSDSETAAFRLRILSSDPVGSCSLAWSVQRRSGASDTLVTQGDRAVHLEDPEAWLPFGVDLDTLGHGRFTATARLLRGGETLVSATARFFRFPLTELEARLDQTKGRLKACLEHVSRLREHGLRGQYPRATLGAVEEFVPFTAADLKHARYERAAEVLDELAELLEQAESEMRGLERDPASDRVAPDLPLKRITVRDGKFWCDGKPQLLFGYCGWWEVWTGTRRLAGQGLNHLLDSIVAPFALFPDAGETPDPKMMEGLDWGWLRPEESKSPVCYSRMLACNQVPKAFGERHVDATGGGWAGLCTLHPALREFQTRYLSTVARTARKHRSVGVYVLFGENTHQISDHPLETAALADYLRAEYNTLDALNASWGTRYTDWDRIGSARDVDSPVAWHDRGRLNQKLFTDWATWLQEQVKAEDPDALCTGYPSLLSWDDPSDFSAGIDMEALCRAFNVNGFDTAALDCGGKRWAMTSISGFAMPHALLKAFNPASPNYDPELHLLNVNRPYPESYVRAAMFQGCFHGMAAANLWVFQRSEGRDSMLVFQPKVMAAYIRTCLDLRRLTDVVYAFQAAPARIALLYSLTSVAYSSEHLTEVKALYEATFFSDVNVGFVTERSVLENGLDGVSVLILPSSSHVPLATAQAIANWLGEGRVLVLVGDCLTRDRRNRPLAAVLPERGRLVRIQGSADPEVYRTTLEPLFRAAVRRPYRAVDESGGPLEGVEFRSTALGGQQLFYAINMSKRAVPFDLRPRPTAVLTELREGGAFVLPRVLPPMGLTVFGTHKPDGHP